MLRGALELPHLKPKELTLDILTATSHGLWEAPGWCKLPGTSCSLRVQGNCSRTPREILWRCSQMLVIRRKPHRSWGMKLTHRTSQDLRYSGQSTNSKCPLHFLLENLLSSKGCLWLFLCPDILSRVEACSPQMCFQQGEVWIDLPRLYTTAYPLPCW